MIDASNLLASMRDTWNHVLAALPGFGLAVLVLFAGWVAARLARKAAIRVFRIARVNQLAERAGVEDFLVQGGVKFTAATLLADAVYWLLLLGVFIAVLDGMGVKGAGDMITRLVDFVPSVVVAVVILLFGTLLARIVGGMVSSYLNNVGSPAADAIGAIARYAMIVFVVFMAAEQLAIRTEVLVSAFQIAFSAFCLALALAFGLGGRQWAARVFERYLTK
jgi:hypothetical protein